MTPTVDRSDEREDSRPQENSSFVQNRPLVTASAVLASMIYALDWTIASVALPHMQGTFSATQDQISWVLTSYIVASAIVLPATGWFVDRFGRKQVFLASILGFTTFSFFCGFVDTLEAEIVVRILQGAFGAALIPVSQSIILDIYPVEQHARAMAIWGMGVVLGPVIGPTIGGYLTEHYSWRWVFYINIPVGTIAYIGCSLTLPNTKSNKSRGFDWFGFFSLAFAIGALQTMLDRGERLDWFDSLEIKIEAAIVSLGFYLFIIHALSARDPMIDLRLLKDRNYSLGLIFIFLYGVLTLAPLVLLPPLLKELKDYPAVQIGALLSPRGAGLMMTMMILGRVAQHFDPRVLIGVGFAVLASSSWIMAHWNLEVGNWEILWTGFVQGVGAGLVVVPLGVITFATLDIKHRTEAASIWNLIRSIGSSIGISIALFLLTRMAGVSRAELAEYITPYNEVLQTPNLIGAWGIASAERLAQLDFEITRQAMMVGYIDVFYAFAVAAALAIPAVYFLSRPAQT